MCVSLCVFLRVCVHSWLCHACTSTPGPGDDVDPDLRVLEPLITAWEAAEGDTLLPRLVRMHPVFSATAGKGKKAVRAGCVGVSLCGEK